MLTKNRDIKSIVLIGMCYGWKNENGNFQYEKENFQKF